MRRHVVVAAFASAALSPTLSAQRVVTSVDLSGTGVWYADTVSSMGSSISPALRLDWSRLTVNAFGNVSLLGQGGRSFQGSIAPSVFTPSAGPFTAELASTLGGSTHEDGTRTGQMLVVARGYAMGSGSGAWIGGGAGRSWDGVAWRGVRQGEAGAWIERGGITTLATVTPVVVEDTIRYTDLQAALRYPMPMGELGISAGVRSGSVGSAVGGSSRAWGSVSVLRWVSARLALVGTAGSYPVDLTQGYPGGRYVTLSLRLASANTRAAEADATSSSPGASKSSANGAASSAGAFGRLDARTVNGTQRLLRVYAPNASRVELNADFTDWQPVSLARGADGWWSTTRSIARGTYQINVRLDGGAWIAPPGLLSTKDEFGGVVGILTFE